MIAMRTPVIVAILFMLAFSALAAQRSLEEMKAEADRAQGGHQAKLCSDLAHHLVAIANQQFTDGKSQDAQATVQDILKYAEKARDAAVKSHDSLKQAEIRLRQTQRGLEDLKRTLSVDDRPPIDAVEKKIEQFRQDLLETMFPSKKKEKS